MRPRCGMANCAGERLQHGAHGPTRSTSAQRCGSFHGNRSPKAPCAASLRSNCRSDSSSSTARFFVGTNGTWARPPAKPQLDKDGRQRNHCFACGARGEVIEFLRRYDNPDCGSAVVKLASALAAAIREQRSVIAAFATAGGPS